MMDDLQQAYSAYQQALVNLQNPKVSNCHLTLMRGVTKTLPRRNQGSGMESVFYMTGMGRLSTPKRPSLR